MDDLVTVLSVQLTVRVNSWMSIGPLDVSAFQR